MKFKKLSVVLFLALVSQMQAQTQPKYAAKKGKISEKQLQRWSHLDMEKDSIPGMSVDKAYEKLLKGKKGKTVIVAVIDSGGDIEHEDMKNVIWSNPKEIKGNGIDDDKNGYVDDVHGWNFLGEILKEQLEYERIVANKSITDEATYNAALALANNKKEEAKQGVGQMEQMLDAVNKADAMLTQHLKKSSYTAEDLNNLQTQDNDLARSKMIMTRMLSFGMPVPELKKEISKELDKFRDILANEITNKNYRKVVGDNPEDINDKVYGNANVIGPDKDGTKHGTHVAGIIAQTRNNKLGGDGVASDNVKIMTLRAVPDGDEYDKDIALAIRYAADNGAKVINGSFGKPFSPHKQWVYDAIKYAESKDVLFVHAAGNDAKDLDKEENFPNDSEDKINEFASNVITIGALNFEYGDKMVADFSNYGKKNVDVFAPGVKIYATTPKNTYSYLQGTSMAAPNVAGVAALIRSYYPSLSAKQVKEILMNSGTSYDGLVNVGGNSADKRLFSDLSKSGKFVNAYEALKMAAKIAGQKK